MIFRRDVESAVKWAFLFFLREEVTAAHTGERAW
jgi:hypothetical protein